MTWNEDVSEDDCPECEGSGEQKGDCKECGGNGISQAQTCDVCDGEGIVTDTCEFCLGDGTREAYEERNARLKEQYLIRKRFGHVPQNISNYWSGT